MYTNNQSDGDRRVVAELPEVKRRRRLENLLYTRKRVAQLAAEHRSHGLEDAVDLYVLQLEVELVLADEFPAVFDEHIGQWAEDEASAGHHPAVMLPTCSVCEAIAKHRKGGFNAPTAA